jgi:diphthine-ammonia ligase
MKVIALLSGGKDSIYNLHHCILNNHEPVCVASLGPPEGQDELDSFMYQTVAHSGLASLAQALELPFYSIAIKGKPLNQSSEYGSRSHTEENDGAGTVSDGNEEEEDETEDLYRLLKMVKTEMPEVEAVAAGAILSNYQRVRVEHVYVSVLRGFSTAPSFLSSSQLTRRSMVS